MICDPKLRFLGSQDFFQNENENKVIEKEVENLQDEIERSMQPHIIWMKPISWVIGFFLGGIIGSLIGLPFLFFGEMIFTGTGEHTYGITVFGSMLGCSALFYKKIYNKIMKRRITKLGLDKHKYIQEAKIKINKLK